MTTALDRLQAAVGPFLMEPPRVFSKTEQVVATILGDDSFREAFEYEREGETHVLSSNAILEWLKTARYWDLLSHDLLSLTGKGQKFRTGDFSNRLQRHLTKVVKEKWKVELSEIEDQLRQLNGSSTNKRPDTKNWYRLVSEATNGQMPKSRFAQLVGFLLGCGVLRRDICHLYFRTR